MPTQTANDAATAEELDLQIDGQTYTVRMPQGWTPNQLGTIANSIRSAEKNRPTTPPSSPPANPQNYTPAGILGNINRGILGAGLEVVGNLAGGIGALVPPVRRKLGIGHNPPHQSLADEMLSWQQATSAPFQNLAETLAPKGISKGIRKAVELPGKLLEEYVNEPAGTTMADIFGPFAGATTKTAITGVEMLLPGRFLPHGKRPAPANPTTVDSAAATYYNTQVKPILNTTTPPSFEQLTPKVRTNLQAITRAQLEGQSPPTPSPSQIARQIEIESTAGAATRAQVTKDPLEQGEAELIARHPRLGHELRSTYDIQGTTLSKNIDTLRKAKTPSELAAGQKLQDAALRAKVNARKEEIRKEYAKSDVSAAAQSDISLSPLLTYLDNELAVDDVVGNFVRDRVQHFSRSSENAKTSVIHVEDIRQRLGRQMRKVTEAQDKHYYLKVIKKIDEILDTVPSKDYQQARAKKFQFEDEYNNQAIINKLSFNRKDMKRDRKVALEDTVKYILKSPIEDILKIRDSLLRPSGDPAADTAGLTSWNDVGDMVLARLSTALRNDFGIGQKKPPEYGKFGDTFGRQFTKLDENGKLANILDQPTYQRLQALKTTYDSITRTRALHPESAHGTEVTAYHAGGMLPRLSHLSFYHLSRMLGHALDRAFKSRMATRSLNTPLDIAARPEIRASQNLASRAALPPPSPTTFITGAMAPPAGPPPTGPQAPQAGPPPTQPPSSRPATSESVSSAVSSGNFHLAVDLIFPHLLPVESSSSQSAVSPKGAFGAAQLTEPAIAEVENILGHPIDRRSLRTDREENVAVGKFYLLHLLEKYGDPALAVAAYNAGPTQIDRIRRRWGDQWRSHLPLETQKYLPKVLGPLA